MITFDQTHSPHTHVLNTRLYKSLPQAPHCLQEATLNAAVTLALASPLDDIRSNAELVREHLKTLTNLGGLNHQGRDLFEEVNKVRINVACKDTVVV